MILELLGGKSIKVEGDVQVEFKTGKTIYYVSEKIKHLILNPDSIASIQINDKN